MTSTRRPRACAGPASARSGATPTGGSPSRRAAGSVRLAPAGAERRATAPRVAVAPADAGRITRALALDHQWVTDLRPEERSLEDLFLEITAPDRSLPEPEGVGA